MTGAMCDLMTVWGERLDPARVLPEYPRPQLVRDSYVNLNGRWDYAITASAEQPERWDGEILVPFSPEAPLSGVGRTLLPGEYLWYRRELPELRAPGRRTILQFGAADQQADVFVNGRHVCSHLGGYTAFSADVTEFLEERSVLTVRVQDGTDTTPYSRGKQKMKRGGIWYTPQSGLWQTVWAELVPEAHVRAVVFTPELPQGVVRWKLDAPGPQGACVEISLHGAAVASGTCDARGEGSARIAPENLRLWTPETPELYDVQIRLGEDCVRSYFAMRTVSVGPDERGTMRLLLNGRPYYQHGVLDQGYWPDGLYTAPSDEAMIYDIRLMKELGFNLLRKHIKIEPMRWYYHCDRLGMLVWQDMVSGGGSYDPLTVTAPLLTGIHCRDSAYRRFAREDAAGRAQYNAELTEMILQLRNCPCIVLWVAFNEGWGQFDAARALERITALDPTRPVDHASGWHDQGVGPVRSLHVYFRPYRFRPDRKGRAVLLSEFGGYQLPVAGHTFSKKSFGYRGCRTPEALAAAVRRLYETQILPAKQAGLCASVYTQLSDVEDELNGFVTYDRKVVKLPKAALREIALELRGS